MTESQRLSEKKENEGTTMKQTYNMSHFIGLFLVFFFGPNQRPFCNLQPWKIQVQMGAMPGYQVAAGPSQAEAAVGETPLSSTVKCFRS